MEKRKILLFTNIIAPYRIGLFNKLNEYVERNIKFYFDSQNEVNRKWYVDEQILFDYKVLKSPSVNKKSSVANNTQLSRVIYFPYKVLLEIFKHKPAIVISSELGLRSILAIIGAKLVRAKIYLLSDVTPQSEQKIGKNKLRVRKLIARSFTGAIAHGTLSKDYLLSLGVKLENIIISPYSIDNDFYIREMLQFNKQSLRNMKGIDNDTFVLFFSGQFVHRKGIDLLINVLEDVELKKLYKIKLFLAGGSNEELQKLIGEFDNSNIQPLGFLHKNEIIKFYTLADCFILPTRSDTWGLVVNEAIACECPVAISTYAGCAPDLIEDRISGFIFDPLDYNNFKITIIEMIKKRSALMNMASLAIKKLSTHNHNFSAKQIANFLNEESCEKQ